MKLAPASGAGLIGSRLRERRLALGLKQGELAAASAISPAYLNLIEHSRRRITPEVLERLARALGSDPADFEDSGNDLLVAELQEAAAALPEIRVEGEHCAEFAGRFPGWARLLVAGAAHNDSLRQSLGALNDRLAHDPGLSAALHELLTAVSGVRSTAQILAETEDLSPDWQRRFQKNLFQDAERLTEGTRALVSWLDSGSGGPAEAVAASPRDALEAWLAAGGFAEARGSGDPAQAEGPPVRLPEGAGLALIQDWQAQRARERAAMPDPAFSRALAEHGPDPARIAAAFGTSVLAAMHRIAYWAGDGLSPAVEAGLVLCDGSGALLFRKPLRGFSLPRIGSACPLWPLFQALSRPGEALRQLAGTPAPGGGTFLCLSYCETRHPFGFDGPGLRQAAMLILPAPPKAGDPAPLPLGPTCRLCPRSLCPARREAAVVQEQG